MGTKIEFQLGDHETEVLKRWCDEIKEDDLNNPLLYQIFKFISMGIDRARIKAKKTKV